MSNDQLHHQYHFQRQYLYITIGTNNVTLSLIITIIIDINEPSQYNNKRVIYWLCELELFSHYYNGIEVN